MRKRTGPPLFRNTADLAAEDLRTRFCVTQSHMAVSIPIFFAGSDSSNPAPL